jgi:hypothetical protein
MVMKVNSPIPTDDIKSQTSVATNATSVHRYFGRVPKYIEKYKSLKEA